MNEACGKRGVEVLKLFRPMGSGLHYSQISSTKKLALPRFQIAGTGGDVLKLFRKLGSELFRRQDSYLKGRRNGESGNSDCDVLKFCYRDIVPRGRTLHAD